MPNTSRISGFRPVKYKSGKAYNGAVNVYNVPSSDATAIYPGDVVKLAGSASADGTKPTVQLAGAGNAVVGVVVGFAVNRDNLNLDGQKRAASTLRDVLVCDDPDVIYEVEASNGTPAITDIGLNVNHAVGSPDSATSRSGAYIDFGTEATTAALTFKIHSFVAREDNEVGASAKMLVSINNHQFNSGTGTDGV